MNVNNIEDYKIFAGVMANLCLDQRRDNEVVIKTCMKVSGGRMDPSMISEWRQMWLICLNAQMSRFETLTAIETKDKP
jgi:hypothetical protein